MFRVVPDTVCICNNINNSTWYIFHDTFGGSPKREFSDLRLATYDLSHKKALAGINMNLASYLLLVVLLL